MLLNTNETAKVTLSIEQTGENDLLEFSQTSHIDFSQYGSITEALSNRMNVFLDLIGYEEVGEFIFLNNLDPDECEYIKNALQIYRKYKEENR